MTCRKGAQVISPCVLMQADKPIGLTYEPCEGRPGQRSNRPLEGRMASIKESRHKRSLASFIPSIFDDPKQGFTPTFGYWTVGCNTLNEYEHWSLKVDAQVHQDDVR